MLSGELVDGLASAFLAVLRRRPLLILRSFLCATRFLRVIGASFTTRRLRLGRLSAGLPPLLGAGLPLLLDLFGAFGASHLPLFAGLTCLQLLLPIPGNRLGSLDLLRSSADF